MPQETTRHHILQLKASGYDRWIDSRGLLRCAEGDIGKGVRVERTGKEDEVKTRLKM